MILEDLKNIIQLNKDENPLYVRNLLKEYLQIYILNYIYTSKYNSNFIFTGGTCLKVCFDLPRLSEDLDFDVINYNEFNINKFEEDIQGYFIKDIQFKKITTKLAANNRTLFIKFPILKELGLSSNQSESDILFVRIDISPLSSKIYKKESSVKSSQNFSFVISRYSLPDLFASKIGAILQRKYIKGKGEITFKGRDYFDLIWFLERGIYPNYARLGDILKIHSKEKILEDLNAKVNNLNISDLKEELNPFIKDQAFANNFISKYKELYNVLINTQIDNSVVTRLSRTPIYIQLNGLRFKYSQYEELFFEVLNNETIQDVNDMRDLLIMKAERIKDTSLLLDLKAVRI